MSPEILKRLVEKSLKYLTGDWVIIGGTVLPLVNADYRTTLDIDMIPLHDNSNESMLALMELASSLGLPVEAVNSAGLFFLKKISAWESRLEVHAESKKCRILRPNFDLYLELKIARFSESDESDIYAYLKWHRKSKTPYDQSASLKIIKRELKKVQSPDRKQRLLAIEKELRH